MKHILAAILSLSLFGCMPSGQKLLSLEIRQGEETLLSTLFDAIDTSTEAELWESAGEVPFATEINAIRPSGDDPLRAEIEGDVNIRIIWTDRIESEASLEGVQLVRSAQNTDDWRLPPEEIRRARGVAMR